MFWFTLGFDCALVSVCGMGFWVLAYFVLEWVVGLGKRLCFSVYLIQTWVACRWCGVEALVPCSCWSGLVGVCTPDIVTCWDSFEML